MKKLLIPAAAAIAFAMSSAAFAQPGDRESRRDAQTNQRQENDRSNDRQKKDERSGPIVEKPGNNNSDNMRTKPNVDRTPAARDTNNNRMRGDTKTQTRKTANRPNVTQYRGNITSPHRYRAGAYRAPQGYSYHHWHYGERLPRIYFVRDYWLLDFLIFGLFEPPYGYVWVRYGDDALLIDEYTGEIVQVRYNVFY